MVLPPMATACTSNMGISIAHRFAPMVSFHSMILVEEPAKNTALPEANTFTPFWFMVISITPSRTMSCHHWATLAHSSLPKAAVFSE